jgi:hypothetical protein
MCVCPTLTKNNMRVSIGRLFDLDPENLDLSQHYRSQFMLMDLGFSVMFDGKVNDGEIGIMDLKGFTAKHLWKVVQNLSLVKLYTKYVQEAVPMKIHQNHFVNCSSVVSKLISIARPFIKKEVFEVLHFHTTYEGLHNFIDKENLPLEYGGVAGTLEEFTNKGMEILNSRKEYLSDDSNWKLLN